MSQESRLVIGWDRAAELFPGRLDVGVLAEFARELVPGLDGRVVPYLWRFVLENCTWFPVLDIRDREDRGSLAPGCFGLVYAQVMVRDGCLVFGVCVPGTESWRADEFRSAPGREWCWGLDRPDCFELVEAELYREGLWCRT